MRQRHLFIMVSFVLFSIFESSQIPFLFSSDFLIPLMEPSFLHMRTPLGHNCRCNNLLYFPSLICPVFLVSNNIFEYTACQYTKMKAKTPYLHRDSSSTEFRQSLSVLSSEMIRNSLSIGSTSPSLYRESLGSCLKSRNSMPLEVLQYFRQEYEHERMEREKETFTSLKSTLNELQKKITHAKRHFASSKNLPQFDDTDDEVVERPAENEKTLSYSGELNTTLSSSGKIQINTKENNTNSQSKKNKGYYLNNLSAALEGNHPRALDHINFSIRVLKNYYIMTSPTFADIEQKRVYLPRSKSCLGKKTLILDIDQTLIHCEEDPCKPFDIAVPVEIQNGSKANAYITIRPYAISFLKRMSKHYEIIAFTASHESYADAVLDQIDPEKQYIKHRLYRKNCIEIYDKIFVKDLRVINRDLNSMVLVDNAPYSYMFQLQNGIPILPYYTGEDSELMHLQKYLQEMLKCQDVREFNKKHFQLHKYCTFDDSQGLIKELYL